MNEIVYIGGFGDDGAEPSIDQPPVALSPELELALEASDPAAAEAPAEENPAVEEQPAESSEPEAAAPVSEPEPEQDPAEAPAEPEADQPAEPMTYEQLRAGLDQALLYISQLKKNQDVISNAVRHTVAMLQKQQTFFSSPGSLNFLPNHPVRQQTEYMHSFLTCDTIQAHMAPEVRRSGQ